MYQNGQTHFKNLAANAARFLKCLTVRLSIVALRHLKTREMPKTADLQKTVQNYILRCIRQEYVSLYRDVI